MSKRLGIKDSMISRSANLPQRRQPISFASHRARIFCSNCNTHFKHLEDEVIPILDPMAHGRTLSLGTDNQAILALWAAKTAMALVATTPGLRDFVPQRQRESVRYAGVPPTDCWVGYVPWKGRAAQIYVSDNTLTSPPQHPAVGNQSWSAVLVFKKAGFKVMGFIDPLPVGYKIDSGPFPVAQVWPRRSGLIHWPSPDPARETDFATLTAFAPLTPA
jgi:hypothetical protein